MKTGLSISLLILLVLGCTPKAPNTLQEDIVEEFFLISATDVKDTATVYIEDLVEHFEVVQLENTKEAYCAPITMYITDKYIGLTSNEANGVYKLFSRDGRFMCNVGANGQGPGEYTWPLYHQIDEESETIYLNTFNASKIMTYDFKGKFKKDIPLAHVLNKGSFRVDCEQDIVYCFDVPFGNAPFIWKQNLDGEIKGEVKYYPYAVAPDFGNDVQTLYNTNSLYTSVFVYARTANMKDSLYHYYPETNQLKPIFSISFADKKQSYSYINTPLNFYVQLYIGYTDKNSMYTTVRTEFIKIDKQTRQGCFMRLSSKSYGNLPINLYYAQFRYGYFYTWMEPVELREQLADIIESSTMDEITKNRVQKLHDSLSENDNNVLLIGKLRQK